MGGCTNGSLVFGQTHLPSKSRGQLHDLLAGIAHGLRVFTASRRTLKGFTDEGTVYGESPAYVGIHWNVIEGLYGLGLAGCRAGL